MVVLLCDGSHDFCFETLRVEFRQQRRKFLAKTAIELTVGNPSGPGVLCRGIWFIACQIWSACKTREVCSEADAAHVYGSRCMTVVPR